MELPYTENEMKVMEDPLSLPFPFTSLPLFSLTLKSTQSLRSLSFPAPTCWQEEKEEDAALYPRFLPSSSSFSAPRSMWQEAIRRKRYLLNRPGESGEGDKGGGRGQDKRNRSPDWLYESYYCMSQQHPLIVFLLLIVMGACLALLTVFFASGLNIEDHVAFVITVPTAMAIFLAVFVLVCIESIFKKLLRVFSLVIWACLVAMGYLFMFSGGIICPWDQVRCR
ncbi:hypothetical protein JOQ06_025308 [Pogonophryne albipinna]|uniref:Adenylate cyclase type 2 n=1 Tax=Pogonophryne albipinna TaxID=1090488 RepID=A0AAD6AUG4_9TELE|nr:hypothetical protein JOQ06_025308 [Pogonophryne albipinna]